MTALEYMEKQVLKHSRNYECQTLRKAPKELLRNIEKKISYYKAAVEALKKVGADNG